MAEGNAAVALPPAISKDEADAGRDMGRMKNIDGYIADTIYPSTFHPKFAPAWTDAILRWHGLATPRTARAPFTFADIGCGDGVGLVMLASAYPEARFVGIDGLEHHVARGREVAAAVGLTNVEFHHSFFAEAHSLVDGADYVMAQGVLSWVRPDHRAHLIALAAAMLRLGGTFSIGYNTLPGWSPILGFQRLVFGIAQTMRGDSAERFEAAVELIRAHQMVDPALLEWMDGKSATLPRNYFAHEYLNRHWAPDWSGDVIEAAACEGLAYVGQAHPGRMRPEFAMKKAWRAALAEIADVGAREIAADLFVNSEFRTDIYVKGAAVPVDPAAAETARLDQWWAGTMAEKDAQFAIRTPAGRVSFDNDVAHAVLAMLESGAAPLRAIEGFSRADLLNTIDALQLAALVVPAEPTADAPFAARANQVVEEMTAAAPLAAMAGANGVFLLPADAPPVTLGLARRYGFPDRGDGHPHPGSA